MPSQGQAEGLGGVLDMFRIWGRETLAIGAA